MSTKDSFSPDYPQDFIANIKGLKTEGRIILASAEEDHVSKEISVIHDNTNQPHYHGTYSYYFIQGLDGEAADENGIITLNNLYHYVEKKMIEHGKRPKIFMTGANLERIRIAVTPNKYKAKIEY